MIRGFSVQMSLGAVLAACCLTIAAPAQETPPPEQEPDQPAVEQPATQEQPTPKPEPTRDEAEDVRTPRQPTSEDIIRQFQQQRPTVVPVLPTGREDEHPFRDEPGTEGRSPARLPDGAMLVDRAGRLVKEGEWWIFSFESDSKAHPEPPMKLLPNQALERMVRESRGGVDPVVFVVTGEVTDFRGENYLLPRKVLRRRSMGNLTK